jgi:Zn-dependent metalloprotease
LDCNRPSGGNPKSNYWNKALELSENVIEKNEIRSINEYCKIIRAVDDQEENTNIKIEQTEEEKLLKDDAQDTETGKTPEEAEMQELRLEEEKIRLQQQQVEEADAITLELSEAEERSALLMDELNKENKLLVFIVGYNEKMLKLINQEIIENGDRINRLKKIFLETENKEFKETLSETIDKFNEIRQKEKIFLEKKKGAFNLKNLWEDFVFLFKK